LKCREACVKEGVKSAGGGEGGCLLLLLSSVHICDQAVVEEYIHTMEEAKRISLERGGESGSERRIIDGYETNQDSCLLLRSSVGPPSQTGSCHFNTRRGTKTRYTKGTTSDMSRPTGTAGSSSLAFFVLLFVGIRVFVFPLPLPPQTTTTWPGPQKRS
jgi:hypothetical protein